MGKVDLAEVVGWLTEMPPVYEAVKNAIDAVEAVPKDQRKPSTYVGAATTILNAIAPLADKVEADIKD